MTDEKETITGLPQFRPILISSIILILTGLLGLALLFLLTVPTLGPRWLLYFLVTMIASGLALPVAHYLHRRFPSNPPVGPAVLIREAVWFGAYVDLLVWLQFGRVLNFALGVFIAVGLAAVELLIRWREGSRLTRTKGDVTGFRELPSVDKLINHPGLAPWIGEYDRPLVVEVVREVLAQAREEIQLRTESLSESELCLRADTVLKKIFHSSLTGVINATGVILHTNLGRAPLPLAAIEALNRVSRSYSTLEYDLEKGNRGSRSVHAQTLLKRISGAEGALVVNNNAGAVLLCLSALANRKKVIISRSQLVEIGGGFRVPDVMRQSGAKLVEVGTTNRTNLEDYRSALEQGDSLVMRAHSSNFKVVGFTEQPELKDIIDLAHEHNVFFLDDLGSGAFLDTAAYGLAHEPMVQESIAAGADLVCFSGDKLLGGPQAGIIVGKADLLEKIKRHPLARALRADKLCLVALSETLRIYLKGTAEHDIPVWRMIAMDLETIRKRADSWQKKIGVGEVIPSLSTVGGGSLPEETLPTFVLALSVSGAESFHAHLRSAKFPVVARIQEGKILFDPRTVALDEDIVFIEMIKSTLKRSK